LKSIIYKIPISSLVVIYTKQLEILLLNRIDKKNYWQSVTGSLESNETPTDAAKREVFEETGIDTEIFLLEDWKLNHKYDIYPHWQHRYAPGIYKNIEHIFGLELQNKISIKLSPSEHSAYQWVSIDEAKKKVFSWTNVKALEKLCEIKLIAD
jgi:dATP pyrophosphohydrolase